MQKVLTVFPKNIFYVLIGCVLLSGCTTVQGMKDVPAKGGELREYEASADTVFDLALYAAEALDFEVQEKNREKGYIVLTNGMSAWSMGEVIGLYFDQQDSQRTAMRVVSKRKIKTNVFAPNWASEIHNTISGRLQQLRGAGLLKEEGK